MKQGPAYRAFPAEIRADGIVKVSGSELLLVANYVRGQAVDVALESGRLRAQTKLFPFPIVEKSGGCTASVELLDSRGLSFEITFAGFVPFEPVEVTSEYGEQKVVQVVSAGPTGDVVLPVVYGGGARGTASATATGSRSGVSVRYQVGIDALDPQ